MEKLHKNLDLFEYQQRFTADNQCLAYFAAERRREGFVCPKFGHKCCWKGGRGVLIVDDCGHYAGAREAIDQYCSCPTTTLFSTV